jgi:hypothetical protein
MPPAEFSVVAHDREIRERPLRATKSELHFATVAASKRAEFKKSQRLKSGHFDHP